MSRGQSQSGSQLGRRALGRCKTTFENAVIIDLDVVIVDAPETSQQGSRGSRATRRNTCPGTAINIDDEDGDNDDTSRNARGYGTGNTSPSSREERDNDECLMYIRKRNFPSKSAAKMKIYRKNGSSRSHFRINITCESDSSESDSSDCEIVEDSSGYIREQWERAAFRKRTVAKERFGSEGRASGSTSRADPISSSSQTSHGKVDAEGFTNKPYSNSCEDVPVETSPSNSCNGKENASSSVPTVDNHTEKPPPCAHPLSSSPETSHDKVDAENFRNKIHSNHCDDVPVENNPGNSNNAKENVCSHVPTADNSTGKPTLETRASGSCADPTSPETARDKVDAEYGNRIYSNHCKDVPAENSPSNSSIGKDNASSHVPSAVNLTEEPLSFRVPRANKFTAEPPLRTNMNSGIGDSDSTCSANGEEITSGKCSYGAQSTDETPFDLKRASFHENDQIPGETSRNTESWCKLDVDHDVFGFQEKDKSDFGPSLCNNQLSKEPERNSGTGCIRGSEEATFAEPICNHSAGSVRTEMTHSSDKESEDLNHEDLIGDRERHKESDEYRRAAEEEWASRMQQLKIQAEEAQRLRRKRKLFLDTERRQKQRLEEIRESQRRDEETINLKEMLRAEVRKELYHVELRYKTMASLLRGLGINVEGGPYPMPDQVSAAYKRALLKFHPDRASRMDIRQQVEAEEKFKLISHLKEKLLK